jgi:2-oxoglutarate ferredoxin oxidoreductase subunit alpha
MWAVSPVVDTMTGEILVEAAGQIGDKLGVIQQSDLKKVEIIAEHDRVFVIEQNRDAQLRMLLVNECGVDPQKLIPILHYDGNPLTERFVTREIAEKARLFNVTPLRRVAR